MEFHNSDNIYILYQTGCPEYPKSLLSVFSSIVSPIFPNPHHMRFIIQRIPYLIIKEQNSPARFHIPVHLIVKYFYMCHLPKFPALCLSVGFQICRFFFFPVIKCFQIRFIGGRFPRKVRPVLDIFPQIKVKDQKLSVEFLFPTYLLPYKS